MNDGLDRTDRRRLAACLGEIVEDLSADAVIIAVTRRRKNATETFAVPFGNLHALRGLAEYVYESIVPDDDRDGESKEEDDHDD